MRNLNPNQFALPGMEHQAHPLASHVAAGARFEFNTERVPENTIYGWPREGKDAKRIGKPRGHEMLAFHGKRELGALQWRGSHFKANEDAYPGEFTWVGRTDPDPENLYREDGRWKERNAPPRHAGIMTGMFHFATDHPQPTQSTIPVHSPDRTAHGERWAQQAGGHMPEVGEFGWKPPKGIHPYEEKKAAKKAKKKAARRLPAGQQVIPGLGSVDG